MTGRICPICSRVRCPSGDDESGTFYLTNAESGYHGPMAARLTDLVSRRLTDVVRQRMTWAPVVVLTGARAVGKSVLLRALGDEHDVPIIDLDDLDTRALAASDPAAFVTGSAPVLIDEFQHVPEVLDAIKAELNRSTAPGRYVLTGSTRYDLLPRSAQSLTGRATVVPVLPLSQGEIDGQPETFVETLLAEPGSMVTRRGGETSREEYVDRVLAGGFPLPLMLPSAARNRWFSDYVALVCERDVIALSKVQQREQLPRLLTRLAAQTAQILNIAEAARSVSIEASSAENYTQLLEAVFLIHRLPAWGTTVGSKVGVTPKVHVLDSGLGAHLLRLTREKLARRQPQALTEFGHLLETFVVGEIRKQVSWLEEPVTMGHWRTRDGAEVDLVLERQDGAVAGIEVKASGRVSAADGRGLRSLADRLGSSWLGGVVLYVGSHTATLDQDRAIAAAPIDTLWRG